MTALSSYVGNTYVCTMVGGWEMFQVPPNQVTWFQARAAFFSSAREPFEPQLDVQQPTTNSGFRRRRMPVPILALLDVWDQGLWDAALWDQPRCRYPSGARTPCG